ncbi:MAG: metalloregulator ArsR/SmtB family transcription factor [Pseudomonas sp.]
MDHKKRVLFICVANSCRSLMAEALLRHTAGEQFEVYSAGTAPTQVNEQARSALTARGVATEGLRSKSIDDVADIPFDFIITLCDKSNLECVTLPGADEYIAWNFADPALSSQKNAYHTTLHEIHGRLKMFVLVQNKVTSSPANSASIDPVDLFKCLADDTRLRTALLISLEKELCVCELTTALDETQPKVSRNLALMRNAGLLEDRRSGQWVYYRLDPRLPEWVASTLKQTLDANIDWLRPEVQRLWQMRDRPGRNPVCD